MAARRGRTAYPTPGIDLGEFLAVLLVLLGGFFLTVLVLMIACGTVYKG